MLDIHDTLRVSNALLVAAGSAIALGGALLLLSRWRFAPGEARCPACRFDLRGLQDPSAPCSECGNTNFAGRTVPRARRILVRAALVCACLAVVPLIGLYAHPASRPRAISWFLPWENTARLAIGDAVAITERLRFPEPIPEDGIMERLRVVSPRGRVTLGDNSVWRVNPTDLGDGVPRLVADLYSGGTGGFGGTWLVTVAPDAPPAAVMLSERATVAPWAAILADHESDELDAFGRTLPRPAPPEGIGLAVHSFRTHGFVSRALTPGMDVTAAWNGRGWDIACPLCADPISDELYAELAAAVRTRMASWNADHGDERSGAVPGITSIVPLLRAVATLAQAGQRERAEQLAYELFALDPTIPYNDRTTPDAFVKAWTDAFDAEGIQRAGHTPSSRSARSAARIGEASNPSSASGSATSSH
ncbi:MAG: hypothetical protein FGM37_00505 [Phycisphaerales bacterium]|nr:hypothetical protein [Phycisphaerales bacterium]